jgi:hypothetical protein
MLNKGGTQIDDYLYDFNNLSRNVDMFENCSLCLNELLRASRPPPFGPAELFKLAPGELVRKNLAINQPCLPYFP